eukprot:13845017-Ditylum_brightwellii.AAC.1
MYQPKDRLLASGWQYMFQTEEEIDEFLATKKMSYIQELITLWYPYFQQGIKRGQQNAIAGIRPLAQYFRNRTLGTGKECTAM